MTSASELFTARRARAPRLSDPGDPGPDPLADAPQDPHGLVARRHRRSSNLHRPGRCITLFIPELSAILLRCGVALVSFLPLTLDLH